MNHVKAGSQRQLLRSWVTRLIEDLNAYLDLRVARFMIWRETRRRMKPSKVDDKG